MAIRAVISDFGGVLTTPLMHSFAAFQDESGIPLEVMGRAMSATAERDGENPLFRLERGEITEAAFLEILAGGLEPEIGHRPELHRFKEIYFEALEPNGPMIETMERLRDSGLTMVLLTNNVREWEPLWRTMLPVDEIFADIVDSAFVGMRKPDPRIYELALERVAALSEGEPPSPAECLFVDDVDLNCDAARELGITTVHFVDNDQAIAEIESATST